MSCRRFLVFWPKFAFPALPKTPKTEFSTTLAFVMMEQRKKQGFIKIVVGFPGR